MCSQISGSRMNVRTMRMIVTRTAFLLRSVPSLCRVVENDAHCMTVPRPDGADAVPQIYAIRTTCTPHGPVVNCENNSVSLTQRDDHRPTLHARALLRHDEFSSGEVRAGL